jgi:heme exporter protein B
MNELAQRVATLPQASGSWGALRAVFQRDLRIALRRRADTGSALVFFVIVVSLFPLGVGPQFELLRRMGPGVVWVAALLASMLALGRLFADDHADGTLEQMLLSPTPLALLVLAKTAAHWLASGLLLVLISPLLALQFDLGRQAAGVSLLVLPLCSPVLIFGAGAVESSLAGLGVGAHFSLLGAMLMLALFLAPLAAAAALRIALE